MAISPMAKVLIVGHRSQVPDLMQALQEAGVAEIMDAQAASLSKQWPDLHAEGKRPRDLEDRVGRIEQAIAFLNEYGPEKTSFLRPLREVSGRRYADVVGGREALDALEQVEQSRREMERLGNEREAVLATLETLGPWQSLETPVEELRQLDSVECLAGLVAERQWESVRADLESQQAVVQVVGSAAGARAILVVCLPESLADAQKRLRAADFKAVAFEGMNGTVREILSENRDRLARLDAEISQGRARIETLTAERLSLQILYDYYNNLLRREQTRVSVPTTEHTVLLEGWVKRQQYAELERVVSRFDACWVDEIPAADDDVPPVDIENRKAIEPFEVVTRLYGMPGHREVDPTVFFAPFFALFFGLCLTDAGYGLVLVAILAWVVKKMHGDRKLLWLLIVSSVLTVVAGAVTGGWFGDGVQQFVPALGGVRNAVMWFDPLEDPMKFFILALALGYFQIIFGVTIGFVHAMRQRRYIDAIFDHLTWLVMLNSIAVYGFAKAGALPAWVGSVFGWIILVPAALILLGSHREGGWGGRIGMGAYSLFSTIFFLGDVLSYLRLMALGMATAGLGMAVNVMTKVTAEIPWIGWLLAPLVFVGGHAFNLVINALGAFVHTLRLQYVEFFPKFLQGGGRDFRPLQMANRYVLVTGDDEPGRSQQP